MLWLPVGQLTADNRWRCRGRQRRVGEVSGPKQGRKPEQSLSVWVAEGGEKEEQIAVWRAHWCGGWGVNNGGWRTDVYFQGGHFFILPTPLYGRQAPCKLMHGNILFGLYCLNFMTRDMSWNSIWPEKS